MTDKPGELCYGKICSIVRDLNAPYKHSHSTVSAGISQCTEFLKNIKNCTYFQILIKITVAKIFTVFISSLNHLNELTTLTMYSKNCTN